MYIKQNLTTRSKNLGYLTRITDVANNENILVISKFKGKDPTSEIQSSFSKVQKFLNDEFAPVELYDVRIDNNLYLELISQKWDNLHVINLEKDLSNPFED